MEAAEMSFNIWEELTWGRGLGLGWTVSNKPSGLFTQLLGPEFPVSGDKGCRLPCRCREGTLHWGDLSLLSGGQRTVRVSVSALAASWVSLIQTSPVWKAGHLGAGRSVPLTGENTGILLRPAVQLSTEVKTKKQEVKTFSDRSRAQGCGPQ